LGSYGGSDASVKTFADGSNQTLAKACRRYVIPHVVHYIDIISSFVGSTVLPCDSRVTGM